MGAISCHCLIPASCSVSVRPLQVACADNLPADVLHNKVIPWPMLQVLGAMFVPYYESFLHIATEVLQTVPADGDHKMRAAAGNGADALRGAAMEAIAVMGQAVGIDVFRADAHRVSCVARGSAGGSCDHYNAYEIPCLCCKSPQQVPPAFCSKPTEHPAETDCGPPLVETHVALVGKKLEVVGMH